MSAIEEFLHRSRDTMASSWRVADQIHQLMLDAIVEGHLTSGQVIHDYLWADSLEVSRTPVREAIQRLNGLGLLDVAPGRFTRLMSFTPDTAHQESRDWVTLNRTVVTAVVPTATTALIERLHQARHRYQQHLTDDPGRSAADFAFHKTLRDAVPSFALRLGTTAAADRYRLAEPHLPHHPGATTALHTSIIGSLEAGNAEQAHDAMTNWAHALIGDIDVPTTYPFPLAA